MQAGTGTGKSLAYLVPAIVHALRDDSPVVVSTATIALQRQLVDRDLPRLIDSLAAALPRRPQFALLKGRRNYLCLNKIHNGGPADGEEAADRPQEELFNPMAVSALGRDVQRLTEWASSTDSGDRDDLKPGVPDRSWSQVSVSARECLGWRAVRSAPNASPSARAAGPVRPMSWSPTTRCWPSTRCPTRRSCPSTRCWSSTRRTSWWTG
ncbi:putative aTP-dependent helicase [Mycobacterium avium subsp. avium 2285 (R)]|nr:putative aTP-dependent helicase [Mycobacterium avium subsp. avium 2285 (R)]